MRGSPPISHVNDLARHRNKEQKTNHCSSEVKEGKSLKEKHCTRTREDEVESSILVLRCHRLQLQRLLTLTLSFLDSRSRKKENYIRD